MYFLLSMRLRFFLHSLFLFPLHRQMADEPPHFLHTCDGLQLKTLADVNDATTAYVKTEIRRRSANSLSLFFDNALAFLEHLYEAHAIISGSFVLWLLYPTLTGFPNDLDIYVGSAPENKHLLNEYLIINEGIE